MDIAIINTQLITMKGKGLGIIDNGGVGIEGKNISYTGPMQNFEYRGADRIIEGKNSVTMPGLINSHIHSGITLLRGGAQDVPEIEWILGECREFDRESENAGLGRSGRNKRVLAVDCSILSLGRRRVPGSRF